MPSAPHPLQVQLVAVRHPLHLQVVAARHPLRVQVEVAARHSLQVQVVAARYCTPRSMLSASSSVTIIIIVIIVIIIIIHEHVQRYTAYLALLGEDWRGFLPYPRRIRPLEARHVTSLELTNVT